MIGVSAGPARTGVHPDLSVEGLEGAVEAPWYIAGVMAQSVRRRPPLRTTGVLALITAGLTIPASARQRPPAPRVSSRLSPRG